MSKKKNNPKNPTPASAKKEATPTRVAEKKTEKRHEASFVLDQNSFWRKKKIHMLIIFLFSCLLYSNSVGNKYAVDDSIVIQGNSFTKKGLKGMKGIWFEDTFSGFFGGQRNLVSGGRYRPFTVATFALEIQLFGTRMTDPQGNLVVDKDGDPIYHGDPHISHFINIVLFGILCVVLYLWFLQLFTNGKEDDGDFRALFIAFCASILYVAHPLHVEAVANIKGRDEIVVTLGSILATYWTFKAVDHKKWLLYMGAAILAFSIALFSKESAIPFLAIIPAALYFFKKEMDLTRIALYTTPFVIAFAIFWVGIRGPILGWATKEAPAVELMNDPFVKLVPIDNSTSSYVPFNKNEKYGTILYTWLEYVRLLVVPQPLTNDYYPKHIRGEKDNIPTFKMPYVLISMFFHIGLAILAFLGLQKRKAFAFALIYYAATFSVVSNLFFPIGTNMAERFMFMPSVAFSMLCGMGLYELGRYLNKNLETAIGPAQLKIPLYVLIVVTGLYSIKTFVRNFDWYDDYTLFVKDIEVSKNSAKLNNGVSGVLQERARSVKTTEEREQLLSRSLRHSEKAISLHPTYNNAWLLLGNANVMLGEISEQRGQFPEALKFFNEGIRAYTEVNRLRPDHQDLVTNMTVVHRNKGKLLGEKMGKIPEALAALEEANKWSKNGDFEVLRLMGVAYGFSQQHFKAIDAFTKALALAPQNTGVIYNLEVAYLQLASLAAQQGNAGLAAEYSRQAQSYHDMWFAIDPTYNPMAPQ